MAVQNVCASAEIALLSDCFLKQLRNDSRAARHVCSVDVCAGVASSSLAKLQEEASDSRAGAAKSIHCVDDKSLWLGLSLSLVSAVLTWTQSVLVERTAALRACWPASRIWSERGD